MNRAEILEEYCKINDEIYKIKNDIIELRNSTKEKFMSSKNAEEREKIMHEFMTKLKYYKKNNFFRDRYLHLKKKKTELRQAMISISQSQIFSEKDKKIMKNSSNIDNLLEKYTKKNPNIKNGKKFRTIKIDND